MKTYTAPSFSDLGEVRTLTAFFQAPNQTDNIVDQGVVSQGDGSGDLCDNSEASAENPICQ